MTSSAAWLPALILLASANGDWTMYLEVLYQCFRREFVESLPVWPGKRVALKRHPLKMGKEATFWHFVSEGDIEVDRKIDIARCERIRWPRAIMDRIPPCELEVTGEIVWWRNRRGSEYRYVLAVPDFSYVVVVADRGSYVLPWTAYCVERTHRREKLRKEYNHYWQSQKS